jgi:hypothetical protein
VGALPGYYAYRTSFRAFPNDVSSVVASLKPAATGDYQVHALATLGLDSDHAAQCWVDVQSPSGAVFSPTPAASNRQNTSRTVPFAETGQLLAFSFSTIREVCRVSGGVATSNNVQQAALTATLVQRATGVPAAESQSKAVVPRRPEHRFTRSRSVKRDGEPR